MKKVLIVDDEEQPREFFKKYLENKSLIKAKGYKDSEYAVSLAATKKEAIAKIEAEKFDFILVDLRLDDVSEFGGIDVFLHARNKQPDAVAIVVSAYPFINSEDEKDAKEADQLREEFIKKLKLTDDKKYNSSEVINDTLKEIESKHYISKANDRNVLFVILDKLRDLSQNG